MVMDMLDGWIHAAMPALQRQKQGSKNAGWQRIQAWLQLRVPLRGRVSALMLAALLVGKDTCQEQQTGGWQQSLVASAHEAAMLLHWQWLT